MLKNKKIKWFDTFKKSEIYRNLFNLLKVLFQKNTKEI
jgi:hypothetical protein